MNGISSSPSHCFSDPHLGMNPHLRPPPNPPTNCLLSVQSIKIWHRTPCFIFLRVGTTALYFDHLTRPGPVAHQDMPPPETLKIYALPWDARQVWHPSCGNSFGSRPSQQWGTRHEQVDSWGDLLEDWNTEVPTFPTRSPEVPCGSQTHLVTWGEACVPQWSTLQSLQLQTEVLQIDPLKGTSKRVRLTWAKMEAVAVVSLGSWQTKHLKGTLPKFVDSNCWVCQPCSRSPSLLRIPSMPQMSSLSELLQGHFRKIHLPIQCTLWFFNIAMENDPFIDGFTVLKNGDFPWQTVK